MTNTDNRSTVEKNGALQITVGAVMLLFGIMAVSNENAAPAFGGALLIGGILFLVFGIIRFVRRDAPAKPNPHAEPSATE